MTHPEQNKAILQEFYEWMGRGDPSEIDRYMAPEYRDHETFMNPQGDRDGLRQTLEMMHAAFPDLEVTAEEMIAEGDRVAARFTASGTQQGQFMDIPPSGKSFRITGLDLVRFQDGKMVEHWGEIDQMGLLRQLGALPE